MEKDIEIIKNIRKYFLEIIDGLSAEQLNQIPAGFNNNIVWHLGHLVASQQGICYLRSGRKMLISDELFANYKPGTIPTGHVAEEQINILKILFTDNITGLETDIQAGIFGKYTSFNNRYGVMINTIEDALSMIVFHEGLHLGYVMAMKKMVAVSIPQ